MKALIRLIKELRAVKNKSVPIKDYFEERNADLKYDSGNETKNAMMKNWEKEG